MFIVIDRLFSPMLKASNVLAAKLETVQSIDNLINKLLTTVK